MLKRAKGKRRLLHHQQYDKVFAYCIGETLDLDMVLRKWKKVTVEPSEVLEETWQEPTQYMRHLSGPEVVVNLDPQVQYIKVFGNRD